MDCPTVTLRPLSPSDLDLVLAWRSNPKIYEHFEEQDSPIDWETHLTWYASRPPNQIDLMICYQGRRVGIVNVDSDGDVSIYVGEVALWDNGIAKAALQQLIERVDRKLTARVHESNERSRALFESVGFELVCRDGEWHDYSYQSK